MKRTKIFKHHYDYLEFDTNIKEYVSMIIEIHRIQKEQNSIITEYRLYLQNLDSPTDLNNMYEILLENYSEWDIKNNYYQLRDLLQDHNRRFKESAYVLHQIDKKLLDERIKDKNGIDTVCKLVDEFGACKFENDGKQYTLTNAQVKLKKGK